MPNPVPANRTRVFISYSHADTEHLTRLHVHLAPFVREGKVDVWDDTRIRPGTKWKDEIEAAIAQAKVAILLVSADFLASEFIASDEVPPLLEAAEREGTLIVSVILSPSSFLHSKLAGYQTLNNPAKPLISMPKWQQEEIWAKLAEYVADALASAARTGAVLSPPPQPKPDLLERQEPQPFGTLLLTYAEHSSGVPDIAWSPDGQLLASASFDRSVHVWDSATGKHILTYEGHSDEVQRVAWSPDAGRLASSGCGFLSPATNRWFRFRQTGAPPSAGDDQLYRSVHVWSATTGERSLIYTEHAEQVNGLAWSPDSRLLASGSGDKTVQVWDAATGRRKLTYREHSGTVHQIGWSTDGRWLASASGDKTVQVWNATNGQHNLTYPGHSDAVWGVAWSPDDRYIASAGSDKTVQVWEATTGKLLITCLGHTNVVYKVAWSPDGKRLVSASQDGTVQVWDATNGQHLNIYTGHSGAVQALAWSPDGTRIASGGADKTVQVWSAG